MTLGKTIGFINDDETFFQEFTNKNKINIVDDILVEGKTIEHICEILSNLGYKGEVSIYLFCANLNSLNNISKYKYPFKLSLHAYKYIKGLALKESTIMCLYDILYETIGEKRYLERIDIFENFLGNQAIQFIKELTRVKGDI